MSLPFAECAACRGYIIEGTLAHAARGLKSRCRCGDAPEAKCDFCDAPAITNLDGDNLCQRHANEWCRAEGQAERDHIAEEAEFGAAA